MLQLVNLHCDVKNILCKLCDKYVLYQNKYVILQSENQQKYEPNKHKYNPEILPRNAL